MHLYSLRLEQAKKGSSREVIEQIAIRNKVAGVDIQHIGDAGYGGLATVENIYALSVCDSRGSSYSSSYGTLSDSLR